ncbi:hypothetical protein DBR43_09765 [Pedobacter sp. KBW06]|nr:hypothetical protein DBR43_09765 [Pedobacter sp. KBW06]
MFYINKALPLVASFFILAMVSSCKKSQPQYTQIFFQITAEVKSLAGVSKETFFKATYTKHDKKFAYSFRLDKMELIEQVNLQHGYSRQPGSATINLFKKSSVHANLVEGEVLLSPESEDALINGNLYVNFSPSKLTEGESLGKLIYYTNEQIDMIRKKFNW